MQTRELLQSLRVCKKELSAKYPIRTMILFGSYATHRQHPKSDVDIALELTEPRYSALFEIKEYLQDRLRCRVDIVRLRKNMNSYLQRRIFREGIVV